MNGRNSRRSEFTDPTFPCYITGTITGMILVVAVMLLLLLYPVPQPSRAFSYLCIITIIRSLPPCHVRLVQQLVGYVSGESCMGLGPVNRDRFGTSMPTVVFVSEPCECLFVFPPPPVSFILPLFLRLSLAPLSSPFCFLHFPFRKGTKRSLHVPFCFFRHA